jgi:long-chain acyl-CoA synthetase
MRMTSVLNRCLKTRPDGLAIVYGDRATTWKEAVTRIRQGAALLKSMKIKPGDRVAVLALNNDYYFELLYAVPWMGGIVVPLNTRWASAEVERGLKDCGASVLVIDENFVEQGQIFLAVLPALKGLYIGAGASPKGFDDYNPALPGQELAEEYQGSGDDVWGIIYTGGTTGHPKGAALTHTNLFVAGLFWLSTCKFDEETRYLHVAGFFHIISTMPAVAVAMSGGTHVIEPKFDPVPNMQAIERHKVNAATFVPIMLNMMLHDPSFDRFDLTSMGHCVYGGSPIPDVLTKLMIEKLPSWEFVQGYGQTECTGILTCLPWKDHFGEGTKNKRKATGKFVYGAYFKLVDPDGREVGPGQPGEVVVRGLNVMKGYWGNEEATRQVLRDGWLHTGDVAVMDKDGFITVVDRLKDMIVSGGENVYSSEVENAVRAHSAVKECAVIGIPDPRWGEAVHAVVVLKDGHAAAPDDIITHCRSLIANFKVPRGVSILPEMPMSGAGKIMKGALREKYWVGHEKRAH